MNANQKSRSGAEGNSPIAHQQPSEHGQEVESQFVDLPNWERHPRRSRDRERVAFETLSQFPFHWPLRLLGEVR